MALVVMGGLGYLQAQEADEILFSTGFELEEGYDPGLTLAGQNGWLAHGTGGNGLVANYFPGQGQQAFVGFTAPEPGDNLLNVFYPFNLPGNADLYSRLRLSTTMLIVDSGNQHYDDFRWSVYNSDGIKLFSLDFDNRDLAIGYILDNDQYVITNARFQTNTVYGLSIDMDFNRNAWSARLDDQPVVLSAPIATRGQALNFGDVDAVWSIRNPQRPGDNYMLFDNFKLLSLPPEPQPKPLPSLAVLAKLEDGSFLLSIRGEPLATYAVDVTTNMVHWIPLETNRTTAEGVFLYKDVTASVFPSSYYRARATEAAASGK